MSDVPTDPTAGQPGQPSEEEVRAYLGQLRAAPVDQVLAEVLSNLLNAAQVKIGRRDARVLLDASAALVDQVRPVLPTELTSQLDDVLNQLRMAQVQAEPEVAAAAARGQAEENDLASAGTTGTTEEPSAPGPASSDESTPTGAGPSAGSGPGASRGDAASRLWVPGR